MFTTMNSLINRLKSALAFLDLACEPPLQPMEIEDDPRIKTQIHSSASNRDVWVVITLA